MQQGMKFSRHNGTVRVFEPLDRQYFHKQPETDPGIQGPRNFSTVLCLKGQCHKIFNTCLQLQYNKYR